MRRKSKLQSRLEAFLTSLAVHLVILAGLYAAALRGWI